MNKLAYIIHSHGCVDQVCETREQAMQEQRELFKMTGFKHKLLVCDWDQQDVEIALLEGWTQEG